MSFGDELIHYRVVPGSGWQQYTYQVRANSDKTIIGFADHFSSGWGRSILLDQIEVVAIDEIN